MSTQKPVTDALTKPVRRAPWIISGAAAVAIAVTAVVAGPTLAAQLNPAPTASATAVALPADAPVPLTDAELAAIQAAADAQQAQVAADAAAAQAAADAAAAQAAAQAQADAAVAAKAKASHSGGLIPSGQPIPTHLETDPNSGLYGQQVIDDPGIVCASHSGSTVNGVPTCD